MLSAIVQKLTGQKVIDYLQPRLFAPLEIRDVTWETCPHGINTGGWGFAVHTEDIAKFAQFYLQRGQWNGKQILPQSWVEEATTFKIQQPAGDGQDLEQLKKSDEWHQGYCYQFWRCTHHCFRGDGAFGQYGIVMPEQDAVIAITSETADMPGETGPLLRIRTFVPRHRRRSFWRRCRTRVAQHARVPRSAVTDGERVFRDGGSNFGAEVCARRQRGRRAERLAAVPRASRNFCIDRRAGRVSHPMRPRFLGRKRRDQHVRRAAQIQPSLTSARSKSPPQVFGKTTPPSS